MRMWLVPPKIMCDQHLLGEHFEMHMFVGTILKKKSIKGYLDNGLIEVPMLKFRHNELVEEMMLRGMKHNSPLDKFLYKGRMGHISREKSKKELLDRCESCRKKMEESKC